MHSVVRHIHVWMIRQDWFQISLWILSLTALALTPLSNVHVHWDTSVYISHAITIITHHSYEYDMRGPLYPLLLAGVFSLFGLKLQAALLVTRFFFLANLIMVYLLGRSLHSKKVGLVAVFLLLSTYAYQYISATLLLDIVYPFFILATMWLSICAIQRRSLLISAACGFALSLGIMTKEFAYFHALLPLFCYGVYLYREKKLIFYHSITCYISAVLTLMPWFFYIVYFSDNTLSVLLGSLMWGIQPGGVVSESGLIYNLYDLLIHSLNYMYDYFYQFYVKPGYYSLWIVPSFLYCLIQSFRKQHYAVLTGAVCMFMPAMIALGRLDYRIGQNSLVYCLMALVMAVSLIDLLTFVRSLGSRYKYARVFSYAVLICCVIGTLMTFNFRLFKLLADQSTVVRFALGKSIAFRSTGFLSESERRTAQTIIDNIPVGSRVYLADIPLSSIQALTNNTYNIEQLQTSMAYWWKTVAMNTNDIVTKSADHVYLIWGRRRWKLLNETLLYKAKNFVFEYISRDILLRKMSSHLDRNEECYILLSQRYFFLNSFFKVHPGYGLVFDNKYAVIYKVLDPDAEVRYHSRLGEEIRTLYSVLMKHRQPAAEKLEHQILQGFFGLAPEVTEKFLLTHDMRGEGFIVLEQ